MRKLLKQLMLGTVVAVLGAVPSANANLIGPTKGLKNAVEWMRAERPTLPPMAFTVYCLRYPDQCKPRGRLFRGGLIQLTEERQQELKEVNLSVNGRIQPQRNEGGVATEEWLINPDNGDCNDYAVTKRHDLIAKGWPPRALLLSEVRMTSGEHHLVLVVRTRDGDIVLDNMTDSVKRWNRTSYRWIRMQSSKDPGMWSAVAPARSKRAVDRCTGPDCVTDLATKRVVKPS